jgi:hypothetical protein
LTQGHRSARFHTPIIFMRCESIRSCTRSAAGLKFAEQKLG